MKCEATTADGSPCQAPVRGGGRWCWFHDPELKADRAEARRRGGERRWKEYLTAVLDHETTATGVLSYLTEVMEDLRKPGLEAGEVNRLRACCYAASVALKAVEDADLGIRVKALEESLRARRERA